jgi:hypothetical protein
VEGCGEKRRDEEDNKRKRSEIKRKRLSSRTRGERGRDEWAVDGGVTGVWCVYT